MHTYICIYEIWLNASISNLCCKLSYLFVKITGITKCWPVQLDEKS